ncbi:hypothetical protein FRX31_020260 [Thalictrum thalictroides]|uniref:Uncharacterized protein n=1 Tax=Thalictrum thalictroides TaxID=46969 RepID=A0A7J6VZ51_THATH|nr:hypothetical protein FRX31_020260 [Thalictrum thalictroides]
MNIQNFIRLQARPNKTTQGLDISDIYYKTKKSNKNLIGTTLMKYLLLRGIRENYYQHEQ